MTWMTVGWLAEGPLVTALVVLVLVMFLMWFVTGLCRDVTQLGRDFRFVAHVAKLFRIEMTTGPVQSNKANKRSVELSDKEIKSLSRISGGESGVAREKRSS